MTPSNVLVVADMNAREVAPRLRVDFPNLTITVVSTEEEAEPYRAETEILLTLGHLMTTDMIARMPRLQWVQSLVVGTDKLLPVLRGRDELLVTNCRGVHGPQIAEMCVVHMLVLNRDIRGFMDDQRNHVWNYERGGEGRLLRDKTVAIVGLGIVGQALAPLCKAHGMTVYGVSHAVSDCDGVDRYFRRDALLAVAAEVDFLVLAVSLTNDTIGLIDARVLDAMKPTAYLINVTRGAVVDEDALVAALRSGSIAGAGLDALTREPRERRAKVPEDSPLWDLDNVFITPHVSGSCDVYPDKIYPIVHRNMRHFLAGEREKMVNVIDRRGS